MVDTMVHPCNKSARKFTGGASGSLASFGLICEELCLLIKVYNLKCLVDLKHLFYYRVNF